MTIKTCLCSLLGDRAGTMVVETAIVAPVLAMMALGSYDVAKLVQRQQELQSAASEAEIVAMATESGATADATKVHDILMVSLGITDTNKVKVEGKYLCDGGTTPVDTVAACDPSAIATPYFHVVITDTFTPMWTQFGIGSPIALGVDRWVMVPPAPAS